MNLDERIARSLRLAASADTRDRMPLRGVRSVPNISDVECLLHRLRSDCTWPERDGFCALDRLCPLC